MRSLIVFSLLTLFGLGTVLSAQDDGLDEFFFSSESTWTHDLDEFWDRVQEQRYRYVGTLGSHSSGGQTLVTVDVAYPIMEGQFILIEDRDHPSREVHQVLYILGDNLILKNRLGADYKMGSRLYHLDGSTIQ